MPRSTVSDRPTSTRRALRAGVAPVLWLAPGLAVMIALFLVPIARIFQDALFSPDFTLDNYLTLTRERLYTHTVWNSVRAASATTIGCVVIGYPAAYAMFRAPAAQQRLLLAALLFAFAVGTVPRTFSWVVILGDHGPINQVLYRLFGLSTPVQLLYNQIGVLVGMLHVMLPTMVLILIGSMTRVRPSLVPAARTLGARPAIAFMHVFLPLTLPGLVAGAMLVFVYSLGFYLTPAVLGGASDTTVVMQIASLALVSGIWELGAALSSVVIVVSIITALVYVWVTGLGDVAGRE